MPGLLERSNMPFCDSCRQEFPWGQVMVQETFTRNGAGLMTQVLCRPCYQRLPGAAGYHPGPPLGKRSLAEKAVREFEREKGSLSTGLRAAIGKREDDDG